LRRRSGSTEAQPARLVRELLLDGRGEVTPDEVRQLRLLFGQGGSAVRRELGRDVLDLRLRRSGEERWDERREVADNLLMALRQAVEFIGQHHALMEELSVDNFQKPVGSVDYVAVREALINLIIHQDYGDRRTVAQIELEPDRTTMVNAGTSLVSAEELRDGGTSTARNPLVARALKLIGFAELAGSGLREAHRLWRNARRQPIVVNIDEANNRFRIVLDSRPLKVVPDAFWQQHLGVRLMPEQAQVLSVLSASLDGMSFGELCSATGYRSKEMQQCCDFLAMQQLIDQSGDHYRLKPHLVDLARQRAGGK
jgi:predicted HTH transcriptional regulator